MRAQPPPPRALALALAALGALALARVAQGQRPDAGARLPASRLDASLDVAPEASLDAHAPEASSDAGPLSDADFEERRARAGREFAQGIADYRRGDFVGAAARFAAAYEALPDPAPLFNMGRAWEGANEIHRAIDAYQRYLVETPDTRDRDEVRARIETLQGRPAQLFVSSEPPGATLSVDDSPPQPGATPLVLRVPPGPHTLALEREGFRRTIHRVIARPGETETVTVVLPAEEQGSRAAHPSRVLLRRTTSMANWRVGTSFGAARAFAGQPYWFTMAADAQLTIGRYVGPRLRVERVEPDGAWTLLTAEVAATLPLEEFDLSASLATGAAYGWLTWDAYTMHRPQQWVGVLAGELRVEWMAHPRLSLGAWFRLTLRNFFSAEPIGVMSGFGLGVGLHF